MILRTFVRKTRFAPASTGVLARSQSRAHRPNQRRHETFLDTNETLLHAFLRGLDMQREELGRHVATLREQAGLKQSELARKLEWSAAVLSRVESGERPVSDDELDIILKGIGTAESARVKTLLQRRWQILPEPMIADPDSDLLWEAEQTAQKVHELSERPDVKQFFERRLAKYKEEIKVVAQRVMEKRYRVAFIGTIAVGKSTAICRASASTDSEVRERSFPRVYGTTQNAQNLSHPSIIVMYPRCGFVRAVNSVSKHSSVCRSSSPVARCPKSSCTSKSGSFRYEADPQTMST